MVSTVTGGTFFRRAASIVWLAVCLIVFPMLFSAGEASSEPSNGLSLLEEAAMLSEINGLLVNLRKCTTPEEFSELGLAQDKKLSVDGKIFYRGSDLFRHPLTREILIASTEFNGQRYDQASYHFSEDNGNAALPLFHTAEAVLMEIYGNSHSRNMTIGDETAAFPDEKVAEALSGGVRVDMSVYWREPLDNPKEELILTLRSIPPSNASVVITYTASE
jgi:hypothetical protein